MILGTIYAYYEFRHIETGRIVKVQEPDCQAKLSGEPYDLAPGNWTTCVSYTPVDKPAAIFVVDVDSFRRKFEEIKEGETT